MVELYGSLRLRTFIYGVWLGISRPLIMDGIAPTPSTDHGRDCNIFGMGRCWDEITYDYIYFMCNETMLI
jgi:hypothetical protein